MIATRTTGSSGEREEVASPVRWAEVGEDLGKAAAAVVDGMAVQYNLTTTA